MPDASAATIDAPPPSAAPASDAPPPAAPAPFDWGKAGLSPGHLTLVTERGWKSPDEVMTSFRNLESATGVPPERLIKLPSAKDAADPKVWSDIYAKLGRPETPEKYVLPVPEGDKGEFATEIKPIFHKLGVSQSQATELAKWWNEKITTAQKAQQTEADTKLAADVSALKQAWGAEYDNNATLVDRAATTFGMTQEHLDAFKVALGPKAAMEFLYNIGRKIAVEDKTVPGLGGTGGTFAMTPEQAKALIAERRTDRNYAALFNSSDPKQRQEARLEMDRLHKIAYPGTREIT